MSFQLGYKDPAGGPHHPPNIPQRDFLALDRTGKGINCSHMVGGRGVSKTSTAVCLAARTAFCDMPGHQGFVSEPRHADLFDVFLDEWEAAVPSDLWELHQGRMEIRCETGSVIKLVSRHVDNPRRRTNYGRNNAWGINDEMAEKCSPRRWADLKASIRAPGAPFYFMDSMSTPEMGPYYDICHQEGARVIYGTSYDNPFIPAENIDDMKRSMSDAYAAQEIYGKWIRQEGRCWKQFSEADWPTGNMHWATWDPKKPWFLGLDSGQGYGHWQIWQYHDPVDRDGRLVYPRECKLAVVVAEGLQHQETIHSVLQLWDRIYVGREEDHRKPHPPVVIATGADVDNLGATGREIAYALRARGWRYWYPEPNSELADKGMQGEILAGLILNTAGERRYCISRNLQRHGPENATWGIKHCMLNDTFPDPGSRPKYRKDKAERGINNCEDPRDSTFYLAANQFKPSWGHHTKWAA